MLVDGLQAGDPTGIFFDSRMMQYSPRSPERSPDQQDVVILAHLDDFQILSRAPHLSHVTGHLETLFTCPGKDDIRWRERRCQPLAPWVASPPAKGPASDDTFKAAAPLVVPMQSTN